MNWEVVPYLGFGLTILVGAVAVVTILQNARKERQA